jgi:hypothetical protein
MPSVRQLIAGLRTPPSADPKVMTGAYREDRQHRTQLRKNHSLAG